MTQKTFKTTLLTALIFLSFQTMAQPMPTKQALTEAQKQTILSRHHFSQEINQGLLDVLPGEPKARQKIINELIITLKLNETPYIGSWARAFTRLLKRIQAEPDSDDKTKQILLLLQFKINAVEQMRRKAFKVKRPAGGRNDREKRAWDAYVMGLLQYLIGNQQAQFDYYRQAAELMPDSMRFLNSAAGAANDNNEPELAAAYLVRALVIAEKPDGDKTSAVYFRNNLSILWYKIGDYTKSIKFAEQALASVGDLKAQNKTTVVGIYGNLASAWEALEDYPKALGYFEKVHTGNIDNYGVDHQEGLTSQGDLSRIEGLMGNWPKAVEYARNVLQGDTKIYGADHQLVAADHVKLSDAYLGLGDIPKAKQHYHKALGIYRAQFDESDPAIQSIKEKLEMLKDK